jgi:hypothetical protein
MEEISFDAATLTWRLSFFFVLPQRRADRLSLRKSP